MKLYYKVIFKATRTLLSGAEKTETKVVFIPRYNASNRHINVEMRVKIGTDELKARHYYNIQYIETVTANDIIVDC